MSSLLQNYGSLFQINDQGESYFPTCMNSDRTGPCTEEGINDFKLNLAEGIGGTKQEMDTLKGLCPTECQFDQGSFSKKLIGDINEISDQDQFATNSWGSDLVIGQQNYVDIEKNNNNEINKIEKSKIRAKQIKSMLRSECAIPHHDFSSDSTNKDVEDLIDKLYKSSVTTAAYGNVFYKDTIPINNQLRDDGYTSQIDIFPYDVSNYNWHQEYNERFYPKPRPESGSREPPKPQFNEDENEFKIGEVSLGEGLFGRYDDREKLCGAGKVGSCVASTTGQDVRGRNGVNDEIVNKIFGENAPADSINCGNYFNSIVHSGIPGNSLEKDSSGKFYFSSQIRNQEIGSEQYSELCEFIPNEMEGKDFKYGYKIDTGTESSLRTGCNYQSVNRGYPQKFVDLNIIDKCSVENLEEKLKVEKKMSDTNVYNLLPSDKNNTVAIGWTRNKELKNDNGKTRLQTNNEWKDECKVKRDQDLDNCFKFAEYVKEGETYEYECGPGTKRVGGVPKCESHKDKYAGAYREGRLDKDDNIIYADYILEDSSPSWNLNDFECVPIEMDGSCNERCMKKTTITKCVNDDTSPTPADDDTCKNTSIENCMGTKGCILKTDIDNSLCLSSSRLFPFIPLSLNDDDKCNYGGDYKVMANLKMFSIAIMVLIFMGYGTYVGVKRYQTQIAPGAGGAALAGRWSNHRLTRFISILIALIIASTTIFTESNSFSEYQNFFSIITSFSIIIVIAFTASWDNTQAAQGGVGFGSIANIIGFVGLLLSLVTIAFIRYTDSNELENISYILLAGILGITILFSYRPLGVLGQAGFTAGSDGFSFKPINFIFYIFYAFVLLYILGSYNGFITNYEGNNSLSYLKTGNSFITSLGNTKLDFQLNKQDTVGPWVPTAQQAALFVFVIIVSVIWLFVVKPGDYSDRTHGNPAIRVAGGINPRFKDLGWEILHVAILISSVYFGIKTFNKEESLEKQKLIRGWSIAFFILFILVIISGTIGDTGQTGIGKSLINIQQSWRHLFKFIIMLLCVSFLFISIDDGNIPDWMPEPIADARKKIRDTISEFFSFESHLVTENIRLSTSKNYINVDYGEKLLWDEIVEIIDGKMGIENANDDQNQAILGEMILGFKYILIKYKDKLNISSEDIQKINYFPWDETAFKEGGMNTSESNRHGKVFEDILKQENLNVYGITREELIKIYNLGWDFINNVNSDQAKRFKDTGFTTEAKIDGIKTLFTGLQDTGSSDDEQKNLGISDAGIKGIGQGGQDTSSSYEALRGSIPIIRSLLKRWIDNYSNPSMVRENLIIKELCDYTAKTIKRDEKCEKCFTNEISDLANSQCMSFVDDIQGFSTHAITINNEYINKDATYTNVYDMQKTYKYSGGLPNLGKYMCEIDSNIFREIGDYYSIEDNESKDTFNNNNILDGTPSENRWSRKICDTKGAKKFVDLIGVDGEKCSSVKDLADMDFDTTGCTDTDIQCFEENKNFLLQNNLLTEHGEIPDNIKTICGIESGTPASFTWNDDNILKVVGGRGGEALGYDGGSGIEKIKDCCDLRIGGESKDIRDLTDCLGDDQEFCKFTTDPNAFRGLDFDGTAQLSNITGVCIPNQSPSTCTEENTDINRYKEITLGEDTEEPYTIKMLDYTDTFSSEALENLYGGEDNIPAGLNEGGILRKQYCFNGGQTGTCLLQPDDMEIPSSGDLGLGVNRAIVANKVRRALRQCQSGNATIDRQTCTSNQYIGFKGETRGSAKNCVFTAPPDGESPAPSSAAEAFLSPDCNPDISQTSMNGLFSGEIGGQNFYANCCSNDYPGPSPSNPDGGGSDPSIPSDSPPPPPPSNPDGGGSDPSIPSDSPPSLPNCGDVAGTNVLCGPNADDFWSSLAGQNIKTYLDDGCRAWNDQDLDKPPDIQTVDDYFNSLVSQSIIFEDNWQYVQGVDSQTSMQEIWKDARNQALGTNCDNGVYTNLDNFFTSVIEPSSQAQRPTGQDEGSEQPNVLFGKLIPGYIERKQTAGETVTGIINNTDPVIINNADVGSVQQPYITYDTIHYREYNAINENSQPLINQDFSFIAALNVDP